MQQTEKKTNPENASSQDQEIDSPGGEVEDDRPILQNGGSAGTTPDADLANEVINLRTQLKQAEDLAESLQSRFRQAQANLARETDEMRARLRRTAEERLEAAKGDIFKRFLEVADNLERAIRSAETTSDPNLLLEGVKATHILMLRQLEAEGVLPLQTDGELFDPNIHEAVDIVAVSSEDDGRILATYKMGYCYGDKLLRPAVVRVGRGV